MALPASSPKRSNNTWLRGLVGILIGGLFFWLVLRQTSWAEVSAILNNLKISWVCIAVVAYIASMAVRVVRWRRLMWEMKPLPYHSVSLALVVGYAMNNLLPARMGEIFRADFAGRRYEISRSAVIGSIALERTLDGLIVVLSLVLGRLFIRSNALLNSLTLGGFILFGSIFLILLSIRCNSQLRQFAWVPQIITRRMVSFQSGLTGLEPYVLVQTIFTSLAVWIFEGLAHWSILKSIYVSLNGQQMLSVVGVINLSTLIPSAPGFAGTYQYAYAFVLELFGYTSAQGIAAATAAQLFLLGTTTIAGLVIFTALNVIQITLNSQQKKSAEGKDRI
jgi:uncharacterized membrane protein YbhN (UPF0104 family)